MIANDRLKSGYPKVSLECHYYSSFSSDVSILIIKTFLDLISGNIGTDNDSKLLNEPRNEKTDFLHMRTAKLISAFVFAT